MICICAYAHTGTLCLAACCSRKLHITNNQFARGYRDTRPTRGTDKNHQILNVFVVLSTSRLLASCVHSVYVQSDYPTYISLSHC